MSTGNTNGTALSDVIVSVAEGVSEANRVLNEDPQSQLTISQFNVATSFYASLSRPRREGRGNVADYELRSTGSGTYRLAGGADAIRPVVLENWVRPKLADTALLRSEETKNAQVQIEATLEAVPDVEQP